MKSVFIKFTCILFLSFYSFLNAQINYYSSFDNTQIAYTDEGTGIPIILIHGFISNGSSWNRTILKNELLKKGYRVIIPDLRGNGLSDKPHKAAAYKNNAEIKDLMILADHLKFKTYLAVGYSRGSIILAKLLTQDHRIKKAVLGGMGIDFTNPNWERRIMFAEGFSGKIDQYPETKGAVDYAKSIDADLFVLSLLQKYQPVTSIEELRKLKTNVLIIAGDQDLDNGDPKALQKVILNSQLIIVQGDHNTTYKKENFAKKVLTFLK